MAIPLDLLRLTDSRALGFCIYGGAGFKKTLGIHTLPPPILMHDWEGGTTPLLPWLRRSRQWDAPKSDWITYTDEDRKEAVDLLPEKVRASMPLRPAPYIDVVYYDNMNAECYGQWIKDIIEFSPADYSSIAVDSLQEHTGAIKSMAKSKGSELEAMNNRFWGDVQDKSIAALRFLRNLRAKGIFIYLTCSEHIDKEYVTDPRANMGQPKGRASYNELPYSIKGTVNVSGQVVAGVQHTVDIMMRARKNVNEVIWVKDPEPIGSGTGAMWEAKDRTGRMSESHNDPNIRLILDQIYGEARRKAIYQHALMELSCYGTTP